MFLSCSYFSVFRQLTQLVFSAWFINTNFEANISIFYCLKNLLQLLNAQTSTNNNIVNYFIKLAVLIFSERVSQIFIFPVLKKFDLILKCHLLSCHRGKKNNVILTEQAETLSGGFCGSARTEIYKNCEKSKRNIQWLEKVICLRNCMTSNYYFLIFSIQTKKRL